MAKVRGYAPSVILVIGGAGYIGSHMCRLLHHTGKPFLVFDNFENGHREAVRGFLAVQGDLRNRDDLDAVFRDYPDIDVVMHFAAFISVGESVREPGKYFRNNTMGVLTLLEAMRSAGKSKLVFSSTAAIFGEPQYLPLDEDHPKAPTSPYGNSKLWVEQILEAYDVAHGFKSVCLRYFNASGADPSGEVGEDHSPEEHLIPVAIEAAQGRRPLLKVFGTDWDTPDGTCVRDYIHVQDLASAHLLAVEHLRADGDSRRYNLGNGRGFSVREVIDTVSRVLGKPVPFVEAPRRPGDPAKLVASSDRIRRDWGWEPKTPELDQIVQDAWNWHRQNPKGFLSRSTLP